MRQEIFHITMAGGQATIELEEKPDLVWRWGAQSRPEDDVEPRHLVNAQLEDMIHDWRWSSGVLTYKSRGLEDGESYWLIIQYDDDREVGRVDCPDCGQDLPSDARFCMSCGEVLKK